MCILFDSLRGIKMRTASRFRLRNLISTLFLILCFLAIGSARSSAQGFRWPEEPKNLKVLPKEARGAQLGKIMRGFASSLGVRCEHCHVGEGPNLAKFDFSSDQKITKRTTRVMFEMVQAINRDHIAKLTNLDDSSQGRVEVACMTCHRTQAKPLMLGDMLTETVEKEGIKAAVARYRELREKYYGGFAYDFSPGMLTGLGERLAQGKNFDAALAILQLEIEMNGESASIYFTLGGVQAGAGMQEEALKTYEKGLEIAPEGWKPFFRQQIERLRNP